MANFADSVWNAAQYKLTQMMQKPEWKHKPSSVIMTLIKNTGFLVPASERERVWNVKTSDQHSVEISTLKKQATSAVTARSYTHSGNNNDSQKVTLSFVTRGRTFKYSIKQADRNIFQLGEMVAAQIRSAAIDLHGVLETYFLGLLNTNKSQVEVRNAASQTGEGYTWDGTNYIGQIGAVDKEVVFQKIRGFFRQQYYAGGIDLIVDEYLAQKAEFLKQQGGANATNYGWQFGDMGMAISQEMYPTEGYLGLCYGMPVGTVGFVDWIPQLNQRGFGDTFVNGGKYRKILDPLGSGLTFAVHEIAAGADNNATYGETQDVDINIEISIDVAFVKSQMSTSNASPIFKLGLLAS